MSIDLKTLNNTHRLLFAIPLEPLQGRRFQPTGFPSLGAATFQTAEGQSLLVESAQSMANHLEMTVWDESKNDVKEEFQGISHVRVMRGMGNTEDDRKKSKEKHFFTDSITESHRINSPYIMFATLNNSEVFDTLGQSLGAFDTGPLPDRSTIARIMLKWDIGSLVHGTFLSAKKGKDKTLSGGRIRFARSLSAFIEADGVRVAASGGVKNDHVNPSGDTHSGFGNVPFARDEFTADKITLYASIDLAQIRGFGLGVDVESLLILLSLYKLRAFVDQGMRLRTACDFRLAIEPDAIISTSLSGYSLPALDELTKSVKGAVQNRKDQMTVTEVTYNDELKKGKDHNEEPRDDKSEDENPEDE